MFVVGHPAVKLGKYIIIADLHIGFEYEFWTKGFFIPPQTNSMLNKIEEIVKISKKNKIVINGDLKHNIPIAKKYEKVELKKFVDEIKTIGDVVLVRGNHDGGIEKFIKIDVVNELKIGKFLITHGHRKAEGKNILIAHNHPVLRFEDSSGARYYERIWVVDERITVMPAFNPILGGKAVNDGKFQGPIAKRISNPRLYLLDGTLVGKLKDFSEKSA